MTRILPILALCAAAPAALADPVVMDQPGSVLAATQRAGFTAALTTDVIGDPLVRVTAPAAFDIYFYGCAGGSACQDLNLSASIPLALTPENVNQWNATTLMGKASTDGQTLLFEHFIPGGAPLPYASYARALDLFAEAIADIQP